MTNTDKQLMDDFLIVKGIQSCLKNPDRFSSDRQVLLLEYTNQLHNGKIKNSWYELIKEKSGKLGIENYLLNE